MAVLKNAKFISVNNDGKTALIKSHSGWSERWFQIVAGNFRGKAFSDLLLYDRINGEAKLVSCDGKGNIKLIKHHKSWSNRWDLIVAGDFAATSQRTALLLYGRSTGKAKFLRSDDKGGFKLIKSYDGWRKSWDIIIPVRTGGQFDGLLFYDRTAGEGKIFSTDGNGNIKLLKHYKNWKKTWDIIVAGNFGSNAATSDVLFYRRVIGEGKFFSMTKTGKLTQVAHHKSWNKTWELIVPMHYHNARTKLLLYNREKGIGAFYRVQNFALKSMKMHFDWRTTWFSIVPGQFAPGSKYSFLLFEHGMRLSVRAFQCADDDCKRKAVISVAQINQWLEIANKVFSRAGIQFKPVQVLTVLNNTQINSLAGTSGLKKTSAEYKKREKYKAAAQKYAKGFVGDIVIYFRHGIDKKATGTGFSSKNAYYIALTGFEATTTTVYYQNGDSEDRQNIKLLAHEVGHYLGLDHTFVKIDYKNNPTPHAAVLAYMDKKNKKTMAVLDGDRVLVGDTPPDVKKRYFIDSKWNPADLSQEIRIKSASRGIDFTFNTDRHNVMSYFNCDDYYHITQDQYRQVYKTLRQENRKHLWVK